jgi:hypothetical protein
LSRRRRHRLSRRRPLKAVFVWQFFRGRAATRRRPRQPRDSCRRENVVATGCSGQRPWDAGSRSQHKTDSRLSSFPQVARGVSPGESRSGGLPGEHSATARRSNAANTKRRAASLAVSLDGPNRAKDTVNLKGPIVVETLGRQQSAVRSKRAIARNSQRPDRCSAPTRLFGSRTTA